MAYNSILITGASSGLGAALAKHWAAEGISLALCGRNAERLEKIAEACRARGAEVDTRILDVIDKDALGDWIRESDAARPLDLVVANAGISASTFGPNDGEDRVREIFAVNLAGVLNTVLPVLPLMRSRKRGQVAVVSSIVGLAALPTAPAYSASKVAVRAWAEAIRPKLARDGVGMSVILPGFFESRITAANDFAMPFMMSAEKAADIVARRLPANPARIAFPWQMYWGMRLLAALPRGMRDRLLARAPSKA